MEKLLAMSIFSAGPDNSAGDWWRSHLAAGDHLRRKKEAKSENEKRSSRSGNDSNTKYSPGKENNKPRFAMEFDGLNGFETIVSH